jgi:glycosyltransferase involved in cell wall biosynthesis
MTQTEPLISVVIPCYNAECWIAATLRSVLSQDWENLEVIVVDDGSADASASLVERDFPQVKLLRQKNQGVAAARNHGIKSAAGEWIAFVDADDIWLPGKLKAQWTALGDHPESRLTYTAWQVWHSTEPEPTPEYLADLENAGGDPTRWRGASGWIYPELLLSCAVWTSTVLADKSLFEEVGLFDEQLRIGEDYDLWLRISQVTPIIRVPKPLALYRAHPASVTRSALPKNYQALVIERALHRWGYASPDGRTASKTQVDQALGCSWRDFAASQFMAGNLGEAREAIRHALRKEKSNSATWKLFARIMLKSTGLFLKGKEVRA